MNDLINVMYADDRPAVMGRELHEKLEIKTAYKDWFPRMCEYGFIEGEDFCSILSESTGGRPAKDHQLTIEMAKQICMIQRTDIGRKYREYFLEIEKKWNSPEAIVARALQITNRQLGLVVAENKELKNTIAIQTQQIAEMQPKVTYYDIVLKCNDLLTVTEIAKDYGWSAVQMNNYLHEKGIQYKLGDRIWILYQKYAQFGYTSTKTHSYKDKNGNAHSKVHTCWTQKGRLFIYDLLKSDGILPLIEQDKVDS